MLSILAEDLQQSRRDRLSQWAKSEDGQDFISLLKQRSGAKLAEAGNQSLRLLEDVNGQEEAGLVRLHASEAELFISMAQLLQQVAEKTDDLKTYKIIL